MPNPEKFIANVKPLQESMDGDYYLLRDIPEVFRALQAMGAPEYIDYDYLLSVSGMAVKLAWQPGWAGREGLSNQADFLNEDSNATLKRVLDLAGARYTIKTVAETGIEAAKNDIMSSIDRGVPVLLREESCSWFTVLGYSDDELYGVSIFTDKKKRLPPHGYNKLEDWRDKLEAYLLIDAFEPRAMDAALLLDTLKTAVRLARTTRVDRHGDTALGTASFDAVAEMMVWDEGFEPLDNHKNPKKNKRYEGELSFPYERPEGYYRTDGARTLCERFYTGYCDFLCMLNGYCSFARFLDKYASLLPAHSKRLREAAGYYSRACDYADELWKYVTNDGKGVAKFKNKDVRYAFAAHMLRAKIYTIKAVEILEEVIR